MCFWITVSKSLPLPYKSGSQTWTCKRNHLEDLLRFMLHSRVPDLYDSGVSWEFCISDKLPVEASDLDKLLWYPLT